MTAEQGSPTTEEGRVLLSHEAMNARSFPLITAEGIIAIEAEARQQALTDAIAAVEGLPMTFGVHTCWDDHMGEGGVHEDGSECHDRILGESVGRAAVIDTLTRLRG